MSKKQKKKLVLIDGNAIIHRSFHALPPFTTKKGELVNAVYGFASTLLTVIDKFQPEYIVATFDLKAPTFRHKKFKEYKATRVKGPDELYAQIERVKEIVRAFGIPIYEKEGFEADDLIGTIAFEMAENSDDHNLETIIVTGDLDTLQLVRPNVKVYTMSRGISKAVLYDKKAVWKRYTLKPEQLKDYKGLRGDTSDNIPGVKGIGEKGAINLLTKYKTLEGVYKNIDEIKGAVKDKLETDKAQAFLSKDLGTIKTNVPIKFNLQKCKTDDFDRNKLIILFRELGFHSLIKRFLKNNGEKDAGNSEEKKPVGIENFKCDIIANSDFDKFIKKLSKQKEVVIVGDFLENGNVQMAFSWKIGQTYFLEFSAKKDLKKLKQILESKDIIKIGWKLKNIYKHFKNRNINLKLIDYIDNKKKILCQDVMLMDYLLNSGLKIDLSETIAEELGEEFSEEKMGQISLISIASTEDVAEKLCRKADYLFKLKNILEDKIDKISKEQKNISTERNLKNVFTKIEIPLIPVLAEMELKGIKLNKIIFKGIAEKINKQVENLEEKIQKLAGENFNVNSTQQLRKILFEKLKISTQGIKKNKTGFSTAAPELYKLKNKHEIIEKIEKYRELFKLKTTYLDAFPKLVQSDGRIHTTFNQAVTATGRLSSENPNLQNIPIRTDLGKIIRTAFEANDGKVLVSADYSQIDLRVMAHMSKDKKMIEAFWAGEDIHTKTAAEVNKVPHSAVTKKMRRQAKALNFGVIYGMSSFGFSQSADISREDAGEFIAQYMKNFSDVAKFIGETKESAKKNGFVETETGRRRYLPEINSPNFQVQAMAERMAINMPIQGLAADIMKLAMIAVYDFFRKDKYVDMILQIHDEIILEVSEDKSEEVAKKTKEIMEGVYKLAVPLIADIKIGKNWGEL